MNRKIILLACLALTGCREKPVSSPLSTNPAVTVDLLFEHDGIKVYRFEDAGRAIYFTDARGATQWEASHGKTTITRRVETAK